MPAEVVQYGVLLLKDEEGVRRSIKATLIFQVVNDRREDEEEEENKLIQQLVTAESEKFFFLFYNFLNDIYTYICVSLPYEC